MKLYYAPAACSLSPHIVLREAGLPFDMTRVDLATGKTETGADFSAVNPNGYVPVLVLDDGSPLTIADTRKAKDADGQPTGGIVHVPAAGQETLLARLAPGQSVTARIDAERRQRMMRLHTTTHLLCHVVPHLVNGCSITPDYARLDFAMTDPLDKEQLTAAIAALVAAAYPVTVASISDEELDANPSLVKSMSVQPPRGTGRIRTIRIGAEGGPLIDLQPCGGTHVANTAEIGAIVVTKIEKKSATTRRVVLGFA